MKLESTADITAPIAVYNTGYRELIGVFRNLGAVARYLYPTGNFPQQRQYCSRALQRKSRMKIDVLNCRVTLRMAGEVHKELLGDKDYYITDGYYKPTQTLIVKK